jgi:type I restriction enzyme S subunit
MKKYDEYKDSGVDWIGRVPSTWTVGRLGGFFYERRTKVSDKEFEPLSVTKSGIVPRLENAAKTNDGDNRKLVREGDFVINSRSDRKGSSGIAFQNGSVSLINIILEPSGINPLFVNFLLKSYAFIEEFYRNGHGIVADLWTTRFQEMKNIKIAVPSDSEQTAIATFLDRKTAQIDRAIAQKERLIELLQERKQIIIQRAVTKGLDPTVKMKDSGVEWIGEVPEGWEVTKLKHYAQFLPGFAFASSQFLKSESDGVRLLRGVNVKPNEIDWSDTVKWASDKVNGLERYFLEEGDLVIGMDRPWIKSGIRIAVINIEDLPCLLLQRVCRIRGGDFLNQDYLKHILNTRIFVDYFAPILTGVSVPHISDSQIGEFICCIPPLGEQESIVEFIHIEIFKIDQSIHLHTQQIAKLKEYRTILIDAAVTGKIKVG